MSPPERPRVTSSRQIYKGWLTLREDTLVIPRTGTECRYNVIEADDSIILLPIREDGNVILTNEYRHGIGDFIYSLPSGRINDGETPEQAARRELKEETGYSAKKLDKLCEEFIWPGVSDMQITCFSATGLEKGVSCQEMDEDIELIEMPYDILLKEVLEGKQKNMQLCNVILRYELARRTRIL